MKIAGTEDGRDECNRTKTRRCLYAKNHWKDGLPAIKGRDKFLSSELIFAPSQRFSPFFSALVLLPYSTMFDLDRASANTHLSLHLRPAARERAHVRQLRSTHLLQENRHGEAVKTIE